MFYFTDFLFWFCVGWCIGLCVTWCILRFIVHPLSDKFRYRRN
jgi:hypothetical protein